MAKALVAYFSPSGTTARVAERLAASIGAAVIRRYKKQYSLLMKTALCV